MKFSCLTVCAMMTAMGWAAAPRLSIFHCHVETMAAQRKVSVADAARAVRAWGVEGVDVLNAPVGAPSVEAMVAAGLKPVSYIVFTDFGASDSTQMVERAFANVRRYGFERIMLVPGFTPKGVAHAAAWQAAMPRLEAFLARAKAAGVPVEVEDFDSSNILLGSPEHLREAFRRFPDLGHVFDTGNYAFWKWDARQGLREFRSRIRHVHVKDRDRADPRRSVAHGTGSVPIRPVVEELLASGYAGWFTLEGFGSKQMWDDVETSAKFLKGIQVPPKPDELEADWIEQDGPIPTNVTRAAWRARKLERRAERIKPVLAISKRWVYCRHYVQGGITFYNAFELSDAQERRTWCNFGSSICIAEYQPDGLWSETTLIASKTGCYRDVDVSPDGRRLLFSFKGSDRGDDFHLYEMDLATRAVKQLTFGLGVADVEGCYLSDGRILFCSSRCIQTVDCFWNEVCNLYRCDADGSHLTRITYDQVHDYYPTTTWDGRVFYTRWEYNDRSQIYPQPLFAMNPDGTNQRAVYGGNSWFPNTIIHARAVPNSPLFFAIGTGHHSRQPGELMRFDPREGREETYGCWEVAPLRRAKFVKRDGDFGQYGPIAAYPYPVNEDGVVLAFLPNGWKGVDRVRAPFGFYWTDVHGARELLVGKAGKLGIGRPVPLCARTIPQRPSKVPDESLATGVFAIRDVYEGPSMKGVPRGMVKSMRVSSFNYRPAGIGHTANRGPGGAGLSSSPPAIGGGAWIAKVVLGEVPVAPDGSVAFRAPARTPLYFTLLDEKGRMVQTMRSWTMLQPGETASCVGCHESINQAPDFRQQGVAVNAQALAEVKMPVRGFSYLREVQPILERRCVGCHNPLKNPKIPDLTATFVADPRGKKFWTKSYVNLTHGRIEGAGPKPGQLGSWAGDPAHPMLNWVDSGSVPTLLPPLWRGSGKSKLFTEKLDKGHGRGITPEEVRALACWVDLGVPFGATYDEGANWTAKDWAFWDSRVRKREKFRTEGEPRVVGQP